MNTAANQPYKPLAAGDYIIVGQGEEYAGLVGRVMEIIRLGSPEHDTGNPTDDIVTDLSAAPYSDRKKAEIAALAKRLGYEAESFEDVPLDSVILAPDDIIRITAREYEQYQPELTASLQSANELGERLSGEHFDEMYAALVDRVTQNFCDYERQMVGGGSAQDVFDIAARIHAVSDTYSYLTVFHNFSEDELRFFLQFQNPLDMVAQHWHERNMDTGDMSFTVDFIMEPERRRRMLESYSLVRETSAQGPDQTSAEPAEAPTPRERLCNKLSAEFDAFIADLKFKTPEKIIDSAYEKTFKEDIVSSFEYNEVYSDKEIEVLLAVENSLDKLYHNWLDTDVTHMYDLIDSIFGFVAREIKRQNEMDGAASEKGTAQTMSEPPQAKPKVQAASREPSLLDELHETARELEARKADRPVNPTKKYDKGIE